MKALLISRYPIVILLLVAIAVRAITLGNPVIEGDEEFFYFTGNAMWHGALPFVDIWDRKPFGLFLIYAGAAGLGFPAGIWAYQALALACVAGTAAMIARLATLIGFGRRATLAGVAYIVWLGLLGGHGGQPPVFYNLLMIVGAALIATGRRWPGAAAMALVGVALQIKYSVVFEGVFFGLWLMADEFRRTRSAGSAIAYGVLLVALALLPTIAVAVFYMGVGHWQEFVFANFQSVFLRNADRHNQIFNLLKIVLINSPLIAMAWASFRRADVKGSPARRFMFMWLAAAMIGVLLFPPWFDHYSLPVLVPLCICAAGCPGTDWWQNRAAPAVLLVVALGEQALLFSQRVGFGTPAQFAAIASSVGRGPGCLYVYSGTTMLYVVTQRCTLSRYVLPSHLNRTREAGATGVDQDAEIRRILANRPAVVVMRPSYTGERPQAHALVQRAMNERYLLADRLPMGRELVSIYRLKP